MNRPATGNAREATMSFRVGVELKDAIAKAAADDERTMSQWIERTLKERLERDGYLPKAKGKK